jgi:hypothetical protein
MWLCHQSITHKTKIWNYFLPKKKMMMAPHHMQKFM